jgi:hypothetical protein
LALPEMLRLFFVFGLLSRRDRRCAAMLSSFAQQLRQLGNIRRNLSRVVLAD